MINKIDIFKAKPEDAAEIAQISYQVGKMHDDAMPQYFKPTDEKEHLRIVKEMFQEKNITILKAIYDGKICGFLFLEMIHRQSKGLAFTKIGNILNLGVNEKYRNKKIGTALLTFTEQYVQKNGGKALDLNVFAFNTDAIRLYEHLGYKTTDLNMRKVL